MYYSAASYEAFARPRQLKRVELRPLRRNWSWFVLLGMVLILAGLVVLAGQVVATLPTTVLIGWLLLAAGILEIAGGVPFSRRWNGFFLHLVAGLLSVVVGVSFIRMPVDAALGLTMLLACLLMLGGILKINAADSSRFKGWGWSFASGVIDLILGVIIWLEWPTSGFWMIGLFVGISLVFRGVNWIGLGLALRVGDKGPYKSVRRSIATVMIPSPLASSPAQTAR